MAVDRQSVETSLRQVGRQTGDGPVIYAKLNPQITIFRLVLSIQLDRILLTYNSMPSLLHLLYYHYKYGNDDYIMAYVSLCLISEGVVNFVRETHAAMAGTHLLIMHCVGLAHQLGVIESVLPVSFLCSNN